jgi:hypothetical protein
VLRLRDEHPHALNRRVDHDLALDPIHFGHCNRLLGVQ